MKPRIERHYATVLLVLAGSFVVATAAVADSAPNENWPQWRGPLQNGVAPAANPPSTWSEANNVKWKVKIPAVARPLPSSGTTGSSSKPQSPPARRSRRSPARPASSHQPHGPRRVASRPARDPADRVVQAEERAGADSAAAQADGSVSIRSSMPGPSDGQSAVATGGP